MNAHATAAGFPFELYRAIGDDRYVTPGELPPESGEAGHALWEVYDRHFARFTGAGLDPGFARFLRADVPFGQPRFPAGSPVVVAGAGPGLDAVADDLRAVRARVIVVTNPSGAAALQRHAISPDLVIIEREPGGRDDAPGAESLALGHQSALLIEPAAPIAAFERGASVRRLARDLPSWGVWAATAVAIALRGGATRLVTLGLDGRADADERERSDALLSALAIHSEAECLEVGPQSGRAGWASGSWSTVVPIDAPGSAALTWHDLGGAALLRAEAERDLLFLAPLLPHARQALALARRARAGETVGSRDLCRAIEMILVWGADPSIRWTLQRALGLTFLPRLWRTGVSMASPQRLWRPIILALHELLEQADRFESRLTTLAHGAPREPVTGPDTSALESRGLERRRPTRADLERVSVVVPVFEDHPHLEDTVASLAGQTYAEVEILIVHDAARTGRCEPLRALPLSNVRIMGHPGPFVDALNAGVEAATGAYLVVHGADHRSHPQRLARQVAYLRAHPEIGVLASATGSVDVAKTGDRADDDDPMSWTPEAIEVRLRRGPCFDHGSAIARRAAVRHAGGYQRRAGSPPDHDLWLRLMPHVRFAKLPTRLYLRRPSA